MYNEFSSPAFIRSGSLLEIKMDIWGTAKDNKGSNIDYKLSEGTCTVAVSDLLEIPGWGVFELDVLVDKRIVTLVLTDKLFEINVVE